MGLNAYMDRRALNRLLGDGDVSTGYSLAVERGSETGCSSPPRGCRA
jgi:putative ABC transport system permease protein